MAESNTVTSFASGGEGFLRDPEGRATFVPGALPGDVVELGRVQRRKRWQRAHTHRRLTDSPDRIAPPCRWAEVCGGCDWMALERTAQLRHKGDLLRQGLRRVPGPDPGAARSVGAALGYRSRVRLQVDRRGRPGFHARRSHELIEVDSCAVAAPPLNAALPGLRAALARHRGGGASAVELRVAPEGTPLVVRPVPVPGGRVAPGLLRDLQAVGAVAPADGAPDASLDQRWPLPGGVTLRVPTGAFSQVNDEVNRALVGAALDGARDRGIGCFWDLFCGAGNFALPLLAAGLDGWGVESHTGAVVAAGRSSGRPERFVAAPASEAFDRGLPRPELVLLDPPRAGALDLMAPLVALRPRWIAYVSCDPVTLGRDLGRLVEAGYAVEDAQAWDMFPQTHHVEALVWLSDPS